jgi:CheY-like chemotaxis protein
LADCLLEAGFDVIEAEDGDQAIALMDGSEVFDLVITDIRMPGRADGNAMARRAKQRCPVLPVIYSTGRRDSRRNELEACDALLAKPYTGATILATGRVDVSRFDDARYKKGADMMQTVALCAVCRRGGVPVSQGTGPRGGGLRSRVVGRGRAPRVKSWTVGGAVGLPQVTMNWHNRPGRGKCILWVNGPVWIGCLSATDG